jgi:hypothetical protein
VVSTSEKYTFTLNRTSPWSPIFDEVRCIAMPMGGPCRAGPAGAGRTEMPRTVTNEWSAATPGEQVLRPVAAPGLTKWARQCADCRGSARPLLGRGFITLGGRRAM